MKSITELSKSLGCDLRSLDKLFIKYRITIYNDCISGIFDGYIDDEIYDTIYENVDIYISESFTLDKIIENKSKLVPIEKGSYIYFLFYVNIIVYIGQSNQILDRIQQHINSNKEFEYVSIFKVNNKELDIIEKLYIHLFNPNLNIQKCDRIGLIESIIKRYC